MSDSDPDPGFEVSSPSHVPAARGGSTLRLRIWIACLGGALVAAAGIWWVIGEQTGPRPALDLPSLVAWLGAVAGLAVLVGAALALWLDRGIVAQSRGLAQAAAARQIAALRGLPASAGWGELSLLTTRIQELIARTRQAEAAAEELGAVRERLAALHAALERWVDSERWQELRVEAGPAAPVVEALNRGLRRMEELRDQNLEAARQIADEMAAALEAARESTEQAERGFVESTALLTTVRELQRLGLQLGPVFGAPRGPSPEARWSAPAREAIEELVRGSAEIVDRLAGGLSRALEIADQVPAIANRATLIALGGSFGGRLMDATELAEETRRLAREVRSSVERTQELRRALDEEIAAASARMRALRESVAARLEAWPTEVPGTRSGEDASRLLDRVREMIQDATRKGERLSATGERASRAADGVLRRLESESREMAGLMARLAPVQEPDAESERAAATSQPPDLRLLDEDSAAGEPPIPLPRPTEEPR